MMAEDDHPTGISPIRFLLAIVSIGWYVILWSLGLLGCWAARKRYRLRPRSPLASADPNSVPGVSILRPLKGLDTNLYENLESTFTQEYPNYEIFLSVASEHDQALGVVRDLMAKYPHVNAHIIIGEEIVGANPKVNNLIRAYRAAAHDILWVIDSNVMVDPGTLARSVDILNTSPKPDSSRKRIAVVHHVPFAFVSEPALGSHIEHAFLNTNHAKMYIAINTVGIESCVVGKSNLYRKSDLERVDGTLKPASVTTGRPREKGFATFGRFLAEDNTIASALWHEIDLRHDLSCDVARNAVGNMSLVDYIKRRMRWIRVRKHMVLSATILEPFTESVVAGVLAALGMHYLFGVPLWLFLPVHFVGWLYVDLDVYASLAGHPVPSGATWWKFILSWALREMLTLPIFLVAVWGNTVEWRGKRYFIKKNGELEKMGYHDNDSWFRWKFWEQHREDREHYEPLPLAQD